MRHVPIVVLVAAWTFILGCICYGAYQAVTESRDCVSRPWLDVRHGC